MHRHAKVGLAQMEAKYRELLEAVPDAMVIVSQRGEILFVNHRAEERFGYSCDELLGRNVKTIIPEGLTERAIADGLRSAEDATAQQLGTGKELVGWRKDGSEFPIDVMLSPLRSAEEELVTMAIRDSSARRGAEENLTRMEYEQRSLKEAERLKDEFVATISHELRTPLTSISGSLGLLMSKSMAPLPTPAARLVEIAHRSCQRLVRLVGDILDNQKMEYGLLVFNFSRVDLRSLVELTIEASRGVAESHGVRIRLEDGDSVSDVRADSDRLIQVVTNLLSNAIKFTPTDSEVTVAIENGPDIVRLSIRDHGPGIPPDFAARIYQKFSQRNVSNTRSNDGAGLGLSIVKQIMDRLGGEVHFADAQGGGTIFHVDLPSWEKLERTAIDPNAKRASARVLLCEDDPYISMTIRAQLEQVGLSTDFAYDCSEAIKYAAATQYRAVVADLLLPDGDGIDLIRSLRELPNYSSTPILVVSADANRRRDDARASDLHVLDWLNKPVDFDRLKQMLTKPVVQGALSAVVTPG